MTTAVAPIVWDDHDNFSVANIGIIRRDIPSFSAMTDDEIKGLIPGDLGSMTVNDVLCNRAETTARHSIPQLLDFFDDLLDHDLHYTFTWRNELQAYCLDYVSSNREAFERLKRTGRPLQEFPLELGEFPNDPELNGMIRSIATAWNREGKGSEEEYASRFYTRD
ncbi:hypothetical protein CBER1_04515 [Cercospora berteroae]|uniref:Uncharacterized protein n=1 Tax=Cercospora berteroae TaxID=357750 RepID=A0A2S6CF02_9PEZI|nr:hypothetical protein CBER1_04515 [Cercospora berteroae]